VAALPWPSLTSPDLATKGTLISRPAGESPDQRSSRRGPAAILLVIAASAACSGSHSCKDLDDLRAQRDRARQEATESVTLPAGRTRDEAVERTHDRMHTLERAVFDLEQSCR
jgi:hypothetical protein